VTRLAAIAAGLLAALLPARPSAQELLHGHPPSAAPPPEVEPEDATLVRGLTLGLERAMARSAGLSYPSLPGAAP
jgi:hypothetical protein